MVICLIVCIIINKFINKSDHKNWSLSEILESESDV